MNRERLRHNPWSLDALDLVRDGRTSTDLAHLERDIYLDMKGRKAPRAQPDWDSERLERPLLPRRGTTFEVKERKLTEFRECDGVLKPTRNFIFFSLSGRREWISVAG